MSSFESREKVRKRRDLVTKHSKNAAKSHSKKSPYKKQKYRLTLPED